MGWATTIGAIFCWDRCYDHNFLRFSVKKLAFFLKNEYFDQFFAYFCFVLNLKTPIFRQFLRRIFFKNHNMGPW
jgi:hypothetical protein